MIRSILVALALLVAGDALAGATTTARAGVLRCPLTANGTCEGRSVTVTRASSAWYEDANGVVQVATSNVGRYHATRGLLVEEARTNVWLQSLAAGSWTASNCVPTITANTDSGPFATVAGGAEADTIADGNGSLRCGLYTQTSGAATWTASCYVAAGTLTAGALRIESDGGTGGGTCEFSGLTASFTRQSCTQTIAGSPTAVRGIVFIGANAAATGSIKVTGCQLEQGAFASSPIVTAGSTVQRAADVVTVATTGFPAKDSLIGVTFVPLWSTQPNGTTFFWDSQQTSNGMRALVFTGGTLAGAFRNAGAFSSLVTSSGLAWTAGTAYRIEIRTGAGGRVALYRNGAHLTTGTADAAPNGHDPLLYVGGIGQSNDGYFRDLVVSR